MKQELGNLMNDTPTPTTNARWERLCCSGQSWYQIAEEMKLDCRQLESELTAAREEIKELNDKLDDAVADATNAVNDIIRMKWQRDRLAEALEITRDRLSFYSPLDDCIDIATETLQSLNQPTKL